MKLCKDCRHCRDEGQFSRCVAPENVEYLGRVAPGLTRLRYEYCTVQRSDGWFSCRLTNSCGKEGRWYAPLRS
jgi:hypothetical protein